MSNHYHFIGTPADERAVSRAIHHCGSRYVRYYNARHARSGTLWGGRFRSVLIQDERQWLTCLRYIEQNPSARTSSMRPSSINGQPIAVMPRARPTPGWRRIRSTSVSAQQRGTAKGSTGSCAVSRSPTRNSPPHASSSRCQARAWHRRIRGVQDAFTDDESRALTPYFTNTDRPVFALTNLPETVKGALFARVLAVGEIAPAPVSRRIPRRAHDTAPRRGPSGVGAARADKLYARVLNEYGDDSVAQLGGAHLACEGVSNVLTKVLEWGRLMAYLEQSTRYVPYTDRPNGRWKYHVPAELDGSPLRDAFIATLDAAFATYARLIPTVEAHFRAKYPKSPADSDARLSLRDSRQGAGHACADCCLRRRHRTSGCSAPARHSRRCCCGCSPTRCSKCAPART